MKTAYFGTSDFAATVLRRLADSSHRPVLVVTPPDRPKGRGLKLASPPAADAARDLDLDLLQAKSVNDEAAVEQIRTAAPAAIAVCAFGQLIKEPLLSEFMMLNVHPSLIPRWRGAAPIERAIAAGDEETGVTIMRVTEGLDSGPVALQERLGIEAGEDFASVEERLAALSGDLLVSALDRMEEGKLEFTEQDETAATYAEKITTSDRHLRPHQSAAELASLIRAIGGHIGTYLELENGERLGVRAATAVPDGPPQAEIQVLSADEGDSLILGTADGGLRLDRVQAPGKQAMAAGEFLRGHPAPARAV